MIGKERKLITIENLVRLRAFRTFVNETELAQAAPELLKRAAEVEALPKIMEFSQLPEYEETGDYEVVLYCV